jgi:hypothetical protein
MYLIFKRDYGDFLLENRWPTRFFRRKILYEILISSYTYALNI